MNKHFLAFGFIPSKGHISTPNSRIIQTDVSFGSQLIELEIDGGSLIERFRPQTKDFNAKAKGNNDEEITAELRRENDEYFTDNFDGWESIIGSM